MGIKQMMIIAKSTHSTVRITEPNYTLSKVPHPNTWFKSLMKLQTMIISHIPTCEVNQTGIK